VGPMSELARGYFMAGPLGRYPEGGWASAAGFRGAWLGTPAWDVRAEMEWAAKGFAALREFFRDPDPPPYTFFLRVLPESTTSGGTSLNNSFILAVPAGAHAARAPRGTIFHEMVHHWGGSIAGEGGATSWFGEGLATYYTPLLMMRAGLDSLGAYGRSVNATARRYYASPHRNLPNDSIPRLFWADAEAREVPYARGALYFADVGARVRAASGGRRSLDDVVRPLLERRNKRGEQLTERSWVEAIVKELGPGEAQRFDSLIVRGHTVVPAADAFGPCFTRRPARFGAAEGYEWVRVEGIPDADCRRRT